MAYHKYLPDPKNYTEAVAGAMSLLRIAQIPFRDPAREPSAEEQGWGGTQTNWVSAADVTNRIYYVNSATVPSLVWLELTEMKSVRARWSCSLIRTTPKSAAMAGAFSGAGRHLRDS
jgi:penicillin V acylase-like amidase (Ntn superfamily)